jgi:magnesium chelatase accessory protein
MGSGPQLLLIHGAGGATHSWRDVMPLLAQTHQVIAIDLPGQGFSQLGSRARCGLDAMATDLASLLAQEGWEPTAIIGHSAGAAIALRLAELGVSPRGQIIGINAALANFKGIAGFLFPAFAKLLSLNPLTARIFTATSGNSAAVERLITGTGSKLDENGLKLYQTLISRRSHVDGTLAMMAHWKLDGLLERLPNILNQTLFITGSNDQAVPPKYKQHSCLTYAKRASPRTSKLGHLAHEESPQQVVNLIRAFIEE